MKLVFQVKNQQLARVDKNNVVADSVNYLYAKFIFASDDWYGVKTAIFKKGKDIIYHQILDDKDECEVPPEVIKSSNFTVSIFCGDLITANDVSVPVGKSGYADGGVPAEPTPDVYNQMIEMINNIKSDGVTDESIASAVSKYLEENPVEGVSVTEEQINTLQASLDEKAKQSDVDAAITEIKDTIGFSRGNLVEIATTSSTGGKINHTINGDGSVTVNGVPSMYNTVAKEVNICVSRCSVKAGVTYILTGCPAGGSADTYGLIANIPDEDGIYRTAVYAYDENGVTFTPSYDGYVMVGIVIARGYTADNLTFAPMLCNGNTVLSMLEAKASRTDLNALALNLNTHEADDISHITDEERIAWNAKAEQSDVDNINQGLGLSGSKNMVKILDSINGLETYGVTVTVNDDKSVSFNGTTTGAVMVCVSEPFTLKAGVSYIMTGCPAGGNLSSAAGNYKAVLRYKVDGRSYDKVYDTGVASGTTYTPTEDIELYYNVELRKNTVASNLTYYPMVREASIEDATYEPYTESIYDLINSKADQTDLDATNTSVNTLQASLNDLSGVVNNLSSELAELGVMAKRDVVSESDLDAELLAKIEAGGSGSGTPGATGADGKSAYEIACANGFEGTEAEWLESLKGADGAPGADGKDGAEGRSITSLVADESNNIIVTFSDGTTETLGQLEMHAQAEFLTEPGFGGLRYYNGKFQYYDEGISAWVDAQATADNSLVVNLTPQPMSVFKAVFNKDTSNIELYIAPTDTSVDGQALCIVDKVIVRRKKDSAPTGINDGDLVVELDRANLYTYKKRPFIDSVSDIVDDEMYYYKAFPVSTAGVVANLPDNETVCTIRTYSLYGFKIDQLESDPASMITYLADCDNVTYRSAYMDYDKDTFNYGDWESAWFIKNLKPCMLNYDGTVAYELDKDDYTKKADGTASDIADTSYAGNVMVGIPKIYWKIVDNGDDTACVYFADKKADSDFHCWSHIDNNGNEIDYCYLPAYNGRPISDRLRSLSGQSILGNDTAEEGVLYAKNNNQSDDVIWYTELYSDTMLINMLTLLIGKSTDTQTIFGTGNVYGYLSSSPDVISTGTMDSKGMFWGSQDRVSGVKIFGIENYWGNVFRIIAGLINDHGIPKVKLTYGQSDGSTTDGYNLDGAGYITIPDVILSESNGGSINRMSITEYGFIPKEANGSSTTYFTDGLWSNNSVVGYAMVGGVSNTNYLGGLFGIVLNCTFSDAAWCYNTSLSCKPLAPVEEV